MSSTALATKLVAVVTSVSISMLGVGAATAQDFESAFGGDIQSHHENYAYLVSADEDAVVVATPDGHLTATEDVAAGTITVTDDEGVVLETFDREALLEQAGLGRNVAKVQARGIESDWKKYLCNAATAAAVGGHSEAWAAAIKTVGRHPVAQAVLAVAHFSAGVFLSTQC